MGRGIQWTLVCLSTFAVAGAGWASDGQAAEQAQEVMKKKCVTCHTSAQWEQIDVTPEEWKALINEMNEKGANLTPEELKILLHWEKP